LPAHRSAREISSAIKRVYVPESLESDLVGALAEIARHVKVGNGTDDGVQLGPINNHRLFDRVKGLVEDAYAHGATPASGGRPLDGPGYFFEPTILSGAGDGVRIVDEEQFRPMLPIVTYCDEDDAVRSANETHFGLSGSVWSSDVDRASAVAARLDCGTAWVNSHLVLAPSQPFGGTKWSGIGVKDGPWGLHGFSDIQVLSRPKA